MLVGEAAPRETTRLLRIAYVTSRFPFSSSEPFLLAEARALAELVDSLWIVPMHPSGPVVHDDATLVLDRTIREPLVSRRVLAAAGAEVARRPVEAVHAARSTAASRSPRIFVKNTAVVPKSLWLARRLRELRIDHVHAHWGGASSTFAMLAAEAAGVSWSLTLHRWDIAEDNLLARKLASAGFVRAISEDGASRIRGRVSGARVEVIHLGIEHPSATPRPPARTAGLFRLLAVGTLVPVKGHETLLEAIARLAGCGDCVVSLDIAGDGPLRSRLERRAVELGIDDRVRFLGLVPHAELLLRMHAHEWDAAVHPSIERGSLREGIPVALMEAMSAALPVVAFRSGGVAELVRPRCGLLVHDHDAGSLAGALALLRDDPELAERLATAGLEHVREHFDAARSASALAGRIEASCLAAGRPGR